MDTTHTDPPARSAAAQPGDEADPDRAGQPVGEPRPAAEDPLTTHTEGVGNARLTAALDRLVADGTLRPEQAEPVAAAVAPLVQPPSESAPATPYAAAPSWALRGRLAEIAGYVGASFVVGAAFLFLSEQWDELSANGRVFVLAGIAIALGVAGAAIVASARTGRTTLRNTAEPARRRLASTLLTGAAGAAAFAVGLAVDTATGTGFGDESQAVLGAAVTGLVVVAVGYWAAPSLLGQLGAVAALVVGVFAAFDVIAEFEPVLVGLVLVALGAVWVVLARTGVLAERTAGTALGAALTLLGAQLPFFEEPSRPWSYILTALVATACFAGYTRAPSWPLLAVGVTGATLVVPEFLIDVTGGSLGVAGAMLAAGLALLASSAIGLRLRRETQLPQE